MTLETPAFSSPHEVRCFLYVYYWNPDRLLVLVRLGRSVAAAVLSALDRSTTTAIRVSAADERRARAIIAQFDDKDFSLTDATSFAVMDRLRISQAFTFDRNFAPYGFRVVD